MTEESQKDLADLIIAMRKAIQEILIAAQQAYRIMVRIFRSIVAAIKKTVMSYWSVLRFVIPRQHRNTIMKRKLRLAALYG